MYIFLDSSQITSVLYNDGEQPRPRGDLAASALQNEMMNLPQLRTFGLHVFRYSQGLMYTAAPGRWMTLQLPQRPAAAPAPAPAAPTAPRVQQGTSTVAPASQSLRYRPHPSTTSAPLYREVSER